MILLKLILAHLIGDFLFQPNSWVKEKEKKKVKSIKLYLHILLHGVLILVVLWDFKYWLLALIIMLIHGVIDMIKLYAQKEKTKAKWFLIDQFLHIISIVFIWNIWFESNLNISSWFQNTDNWIYATALLIITSVSSIIIQSLMHKWSNSINESNKSSLSNAGKYIGMLERLFVFVFVVTGRWEGIGFLLTAKSVFRFGDLKESKDRKLTEYILIGTLLSFGIAIATGMIVLTLTTSL